MTWNTCHCRNFTNLCSDHLQLASACSYSGLVRLLADRLARYSAVKYGRAVVMIAVIVGDLGHADRMCDAVTGCNKTVVLKTVFAFTCNLTCLTN